MNKQLKTGKQEKKKVSITVHLGKIRELKIQTPSIATHGARLDSTIKKTTIRALK